MVVYPCGNYRSASTGVRHLVNKMVKNHHNINVNNDYPHQKCLEIELDDNGIIIYTYRDVRNVISSFIKKSEDTVPGNSFGSYSKLKILHETPINFLLKYYIKTDNIIKEKALQNPKNYIIFRYETDIINNMEFVLEKLSNKLGITTNYDILKKPLVTIEGFKNDINWSNHISDGNSDFKKLLNEDQVKELESNNEINEWLQRNGYELSE